jgi:hypothetical protein
MITTVTVHCSLSLSFTLSSPSRPPPATTCFLLILEFLFLRKKSKEHHGTVSLEFYETYRISVSNSVYSIFTII